MQEIRVLPTRVELAHCNFARMPVAQATMWDQSKISSGTNSNVIKQECAMGLGEEWETFLEQLSKWRYIV